MAADAMGPRIEAAQPFIGISAAQEEVWMKRADKMMESAGLQSKICRVLPQFLPVHPRRHARSPSISTPPVET